MFLRVHLLVFASLANVCWLHFEVNPLALLRHERATTRFGKSHNFMCSGAGEHSFFCVHTEESIKLVAGPSMLNQSGEWVKVNWSGVILPQKLDWIGVWLLPNDSFSIDAKQQAPVKYQVQWPIVNISSKRWF